MKRIHFSDHEQRRYFSDLLLGWFSRAKRSLPWREGYEPYGVWISEILLQQTQMERGVRYYLEWMRRFPDVRSVAEAGLDEVLLAWEGLGYYARARNLHAAARMIMDEYGGEFPSGLEDIRRLPGVGRYTAAAIASIAFDVCEPAVDANVLRIFSRLFDIDEPVGGREVFAFVEEEVRGCMEAGVESPRLFNQALMEFGALVCGKRAKCGECPVRGFCLGFSRGTVGERPVKVKRGKCVERVAVAGVVMVGEGEERRVFIRRRPEKGLWAGLWEFPWYEVVEGGDMEGGLVLGVFGDMGMRVWVEGEVGVVRHGYTTNRVTLHGYFCGVGEMVEVEGGEWVGVDELGGRSFSAGHRKLLEVLGWK